MKTHIRTLIITMITLGMGTGQSYAGDEAIAAIGGFLAGIITGAAIDDHHDSHHHGTSVRISTGGVYHRSYHYTGSRCHTHGRYECSACVTYGHRKSGHWEIRHVKVWTPGHWEFVRNSCGDHIRIWKSGYYTTRPEKVWVAYSARSHRTPIVIR